MEIGKQISTWRARFSSVLTTDPVAGSSAPLLGNIAVSKHIDEDGAAPQRPIVEIAPLRLVWVFFRIGLLTFGGGFAMATVMRHELVLKRRWLSENDFISEMSVATVVPGAVAVNLAFLQGRRMGGRGGAAAAVAGTILPSFVVMLLIVLFALPYLDNPRISAFLKGCAVAVGAQIIFAAFTFARQMRRQWRTLAACGAGLALLFAGLHPVLAVLAATATGYLLGRDASSARGRHDNTHKRTP